MVEVRLLGTEDQARKFCLGVILARFFARVGRFSKVDAGLEDMMVGTAVVTTVASWRLTISSV
jgi:hypothetical protein